MPTRKSNIFTNKFTVTLGANKEKGIRIVSFINPYTNKKTSRSIGKIEEISDSNALVIKNDLEEILNNMDYYIDYGNFKREIVNKRKAFSILFYGTKNWIKLMYDNAEKADNTFIEIFNKNKICYDNSIALIGLEDSGKTALLMQVIGNNTYKRLVPIINSYVKFNKQNLLKASIIFTKPINYELFDKVYKYLYKFSNKEKFKLHFSYVGDKNVGVVSIQFQLDNNGKPLDEEIRVVFNQALNIIICKNDFDYCIESLKVEGYFESKLKVLKEILADTESLLLMDFESIKFNMKYSSNNFENIKLLKPFKKIVWMIDINHFINQDYINIFKLLKNSNNIDKTELLFSKCDLYLDNVNNNLPERGSSFLYRISPELLDKTMNFLGDMNKPINDDIIKINYRNKLIKDTFSQTFKESLTNVFNN